MKSPFSVPGQGQGQGMKLDRYEWKKLLLDASPGRSEPAEYRVPEYRVSRLRPSASFFVVFCALLFRDTSEITLGQPVEA